MPSAPQPRVRTFRHEPGYSDEAYATCIVYAVSGSPHTFDVTITQAKAFKLELARAIVEYELIQGDSPAAPPSGGT
jgi:hypothetical protein